jgi:hypothetical protein
LHMKDFSEVRLFIPVNLLDVRRSITDLYKFTSTERRVHSVHRAISIKDHGK